MERTLSQETEAPLSDDAFDMLVTGLGDDMRGNSIFHSEVPLQTNTCNGLIKTEEVSSTPEPASQPLQFYNFPPCAQGFQTLPALTRTYSFERHNHVPPNPSRVDYSGVNDFCLKFDESGVISKSMPWTYSKGLTKLFCQIGIGVPVKFITKGNVPRGAYVRAILVAKSNDTDILLSCPKHADELRKKGNQNFAHVLQCYGPNAAHGICPNTQRHSVRFPMLPCQAGVDYQCEVFHFQCFSSCFRKEIEAIFTLEINGEVLGRRTIGVRICACPGRDRDSLEKKDRMVKRQAVLRRNLSSSDEEKKKCWCRKRPKVNTKASSGSEAYIVMTNSKKKFDAMRELFGGDPSMVFVDNSKTLERTSSGDVTTWVTTSKQNGRKENRPEN